MIIRVDYRDIEVRAMVGEDVGKLTGSFQDKLGLIEIDPDTLPQVQADTLIHELLHAFWQTRGWPQRMTEEQICTKIGGAFATLIRDNPAMCEALECALRSGKPIL